MVLNSVLQAWNNHTLPNQPELTGKKVCGDTQQTIRVKRHFSKSTSCVQERKQSPEGGNLHGEEQCGRWRRVLSNDLLETEGDNQISSEPGGEGSLPERWCGRETIAEQKAQPGETGHCRMVQWTVCVVFHHEGDAKRRQEIKINNLFSSWKQLPWRSQRDLWNRSPNLLRNYLGAGGVRQQHLLMTQN